MVLGVHTFLLYGILAVWQASSQAPGDENARCVNQHAPYPPNTRMLMDSRNYEQLITGSGAVWQALNVDGTGRGVINVLLLIFFNMQMQVYISCTIHWYSVQCSFII